MECQCTLNGCAQRGKTLTMKPPTDKQWNDFSKRLQACGGEKACEATARGKYLRLSSLQDAQLATCDTRGDCHTLRNNVLQGREAMLQLVNIGKLPAGYATGSFIVRPHAQHARRLLLGKDFINQAMLNVDAPGVGACQVAHQFFKRWRFAEWVSGQQVQQFLRLGLEAAGG